MSMGLPVCGFLDDLSAVRGGDLDALGRLFERFRVYLLVIANRELNDDLRVKCGASDVVQDTLCEVHSGFGLFRGATEEDLRAWLRRALLNNLHDLTRHYVGTRKRDLRDEIPIEASPRETLIDSGLTPGANLVAAEETARLELRVATPLGRLSSGHRSPFPPGVAFRHDRRHHESVEGFGEDVVVSRGREAARRVGGCP